MKKTTITIKIKKHGAEDRYSSEPQKAHPTAEFVIVFKGTFVVQYAYQLLFLGGNFWGMRHFWGSLLKQYYRTF